MRARSACAQTLCACPKSVCIFRTGTAGKINRLAVSDCPCERFGTGCLYAAINSQLRKSSLTPSQTHSACGLIRWLGGRFRHESLPPRASRDCATMTAQAQMRKNPAGCRQERPKCSGSLMGAPSHPPRCIICASAKGIHYTGMGVHHDNDGQQRRERTGPA